jgi:GDP-L-fucose synthase
MPTASPATISLDAKIFVAGHRGLAGSAIMRALRAEGYHNLPVRTHAELDLTQHAMVQRFFQEERPEYVFLAAAKVGGILAHANAPVDFILQNIRIQNNVLSAAYASGVKRLLFLGSSCIYPRECPQPIREEYLLTGPLESTNRPYALAKIAGIELCWAMNRQYGTRFLSAMPTNLYGFGDNYDLRTSHVVPALLRKMHEAKLRQERTVGIWGTGKPRREFMHSDDMARAVIYLMQLPEDNFLPLVRSEELPPLINVGTGSDLTIRELAELVREVVGYDGELVFDSTKPDGTPQKLLDCSRLEALGWTPSISLRQGLASTYEAFTAGATVGA